MWINIKYTNKYSNKTKLYICIENNRWEINNCYFTKLKQYLHYLLKKFKQLEIKD